MKIAFFGSSIVSAYWNGAATYYRGIVRALAERGHEITFYEPDAYERQKHRDIDDPEWVRVVVYPPTPDEVLRMVDRARGADLVVKASGVGVHDALLEEAVLALKGPTTRVVFWDVDAPATLDRMTSDESDPFRSLVPAYDMIFTYGGGPPVVDAYMKFGARRCVPIYNALDPATHHPVTPDSRFSGALGFLGNRLPDREARVEQFFLEPAAALSHYTFRLGGAGWGDKPMSPNVRYLGHVYTRDHNAFNATPLAVLNISRDSMASYGFSPATRVFEAAGAGACLITDAWTGLAQFLEPEREVLVAESGEDVIRHLVSLSPERARDIGAAAYARMHRDHTYAHRARDVEAALGEQVRPRTASPLPRKLSIDSALAPGVQRAAAKPGLSIVIAGLSITSSWGNGHATTYRSLVRELAARGHQVTFLERDVPWYAAHRDLPQPPYARTVLYRDFAELRARFTSTIRDADVAIVGSYVPDGIAVGRWIQENARGITAFYDIDTPVTLEQLGKGTCEYIARELIPGYQLYLSFTGGPTLQRIERELGSPRARALYCSVDPELYAPEPQPLTWDLGYMGTYSDDRQPTLQQLLLEPARHQPERRFVVVGAQYPAAIEWPFNVDRIDHVAPDAHRAFYNRCKFALNVTRAAMTASGFSPSVRVFEAAACGVPIISDAWPGLTELLEPDREVLIARTTDDVLGYLRELDEPSRAAIGARARGRVLGAHTAAHRAAELEAYIEEVR